jgi:uncharacterized membrane protein
MMSKAVGVFVLIATYPSETAARPTPRSLRAGALGTYDAAVLTKDAKGNVHEYKNQPATRQGGWGGLAAGAVLGLLFPPSFIGPAGVGGVGGDLCKDLSRSDVKDLGEPIDTGEACLPIVDESRIEQAIKKAGLKAEKQVGEGLDVDSKDIDAAVKDEAKQLDAPRRPALTFASTRQYKSPLLPGETS